MSSSSFFAAGGGEGFRSSSTTRTGGGGKKEKLRRIRQLLKGRKRRRTARAEAPGAPGAPDPPILQRDQTPCSICLCVPDSNTRASLLLQSATTRKRRRGSRVGSLLACPHTFCFACIKAWAAQTNRCPLCKAKFFYLRRELSAKSSGEDLVPVENKQQTYEPDSEDERLARRLQQVEEDREDRDDEDDENSAADHETEDDEDSRGEDDGEEEEEEEEYVEDEQDEGTRQSRRRRMQQETLFGYERDGFVVEDTGSSDGDDGGSDDGSDDGSGADGGGGEAEGARESVAPWDLAAERREWPALGEDGERERGRRRTEHGSEESEESEESETEPIRHDHRHKDPREGASGGESQFFSSFRFCSSQHTLGREGMKRRANTAATRGKKEREELSVADGTDCREKAREGTSMQGDAPSGRRAGQGPWKEEHPQQESGEDEADTGEGRSGIFSMQVAKSLDAFSYHSSRVSGPTHGSSAAQPLARGGSFDT